MTAGRAEHEAFITANYLYVEQAAGATTEIVIGDPSLTGVNGYVYGALTVDGSVEWRAGTYRPLLNPNNTEASPWFASGNFLIGNINYQGATGPVLGPTSGQQLKTFSRTYGIIKPGQY